MSLTLYYHPLSSFCWKALIALYENATPFTPHLVDFGDLIARAKFYELWPIGKFPVLRDEARDRTSHLVGTLDHIDKETHEPAGASYAWPVFARPCKKI